MMEFGGFALFVASVVLGRSDGGDDWARFDHCVFVVSAADASGLRVIDGDRAVDVKVLGVRAEGDGWRALIGRRVTLLLAGPQTRDHGRLRAYVFVDGKSLAVETVKAGDGRVDRADAGDYRGALYPAQADAKKHYRGVWAATVVSHAGE